MKRILSLLLLSLAGLASAQEATINSPVARPAEAKYTLARTDINFDANTIVVTVNVKGSGNEQIRYYNVVVPDSAHPTATFAVMLTAIGTARSGETGIPERRANFRILGYLLDTGYAPGVTLVP